MRNRPVSRKTVPLWAGVLLALVGVLVAATGQLLVRLSGNIAVIDTGDALRPATAPIERAQPKTAITIALLGSDTRDGQGRGFGTAEGARSDTTMVLHVNAERTAAAVLSIPRDLWVDIPACRQADGSWSEPQTTRFNAAFTVGGPACTVRTLTELLGMSIQHVAVVDFRGFKTIIDALGGVEICLSEPANDPKSKLKLPAGRQWVTGDDALAFVRARKTLGNGSDIGRIDRQKMFLASIARTAESTGLITDPVRLFKVLDAATKALSTDRELASVTALGNLARDMAKVGAGNIQFLTIPWLPRPEDGGNTVIVDEDQAAPILQALRASALPIVKPTTAPAAPTSTPSPQPPDGSRATPTSSPTATPSAVPLGITGTVDPCAPAK